MPSTANAVANSPASQKVTARAARERVEQEEPAARIQRHRPAIAVTPDAHAGAP
jgi:hypothetical protein